MILAASLSGCADIAIIETTPVPTSSSLALPPIGFNHRYGNNPVAAKDGFALERSMFSSRVFWEVAIRTEPEAAGYVDMTNAAAVSAARHAVHSVTLVIATEDGKTITGLLAFNSDSGQLAYCKWMLDRLFAYGYDAVTSATVQVFFTEADNHATMTWNKASGYTFQVHDNDLRSTGITPRPGQTPLPTPNAH